MCFATSAQIINPKNQYRHRLDVMKCWNLFVNIECKRERERKLELKP